MFYLFRSRAKLVKYLLTAFLLVLALSMLTYLIPGFGSSTDSSSGQVIAEIGKDTLTTLDAERGLRRALQSRQMPPELAQLYVPQIIDQMISERALAYEAQRLGFDVSKTELADAIQTAIPQLFPNGQFAGKEAYANFLSQQNTSIPEFEDNMRKQMLLTKLRDLALQGVIVTPAEVEKEYRRKNYKVKLEFVAISTDKLKSQVSVTDQQIQEFYSKNAAQFRTPEKRSFDMLVADPAKIAEAITIPDAELLRAYNANLDRFRMPERVKVRHILLKTTEKPPAEIPKIQAKAEDLLKQLKAGADFATLAKKNSEDPGSAEKGGDLGWIARGQTVKNFEDTAFSLKPNELSGVIKTEYGFHIIQVLEKEPARVKPFSEVKNDLADDRKKQMVNDREQTMADQARAALVKAPLDGEKIAAQLGAEFYKVDKVSPGDPIPQIGVNKEFEEALSSLKRGEVSPVLQAPGNKLVVVAVTDVVPSGQAPLSEVAGKIRQSLTDTKVLELLSQRANEVVKKSAGRK